MATKRITDLNPKAELDTSDLIQVYDNLNYNDYKMSGYVLLNPDKISFEPTGSIQSTKLIDALHELADEAVVSSPDYYKYLDGPFSVTVGPNGDYELLSDAIHAFSRVRKTGDDQQAPIYTGDDNPFVLITLESGYVLNETIELKGGEFFGHITIRQEDKVVYTESIPDFVSTKGLIAISNGTVGPNLEMNIDMDNLFVSIPGIYISGEGSTLLMHGLGITVKNKNTTGIIVNSGARLLYVDKTEFTSNQFPSLSILNSSNVGLSLDGGSVICTINNDFDVRVLGSKDSLILKNNSKLNCVNLNISGIGSLSSSVTGTVVSLDNNSMITADNLSLTSSFNSDAISLDNNSNIVVGNISFTGNPTTYINLDNSSTFCASSGEIYSNINIDQLFKVDNGSRLLLRSPTINGIKVFSNGGFPIDGFVFADSNSTVIAENVQGLTGQNKPFFFINNGSIVNKINSIGDSNVTVGVWSRDGIVSEA